MAGNVTLRRPISLGLGQVKFTDSVNDALNQVGVGTNGRYGERPRLSGRNGEEF